MALNGERRLWRTLSEVPKGVKVLGVKVAMPRVVIETQDGQQMPALMNSTTVFIETNEEEWEAIGGNVAKANVKAKELGPWLAACFGGYVLRWHD